jgi:hypothetical protein
MIRAPDGDSLTGPVAGCQQIGCDYFCQLIQLPKGPSDIIDLGLKAINNRFLVGP